MRLPDEFDDPDALESFLDDEFPLGDGTADGEATAWCPYCGEPVELMLDPGSGARQRYVQDCDVCCRPWEVRVEYDAEGRARVELRGVDE